MRLAQAFVSLSRRTSTLRSIASSSGLNRSAYSCCCSAQSQQLQLLRTPSFPGQTTSTTSLRMMSTSNNNTPGSDMLAAFPRATLGQDVAGAMEALATADAVCFDVDSTVITEEGIDVLAEHLGKGEQVSALTAAAMEGGMKFQDALAARLELLEPSKQQILECIEQHPFQLTAGVEEFIVKLHAAGKDVWLVSGGFRIMIEPVAEKLNISVTNIVANTILFDENTESGVYAGFDTTEPTSRDMGKPAALTQIQAAKQYHTMVMIGDGATDAQAKPPAAAFIGFGGVAVREKVKNTADWFVTDFSDLIHIVDTYGGGSKK